MFANYRYFLVLAEECNINRAAERLFITHQSLSKYLTQLEKSCGIQLYERRPHFRLTAAGQLLYEKYRAAEGLERDFRETITVFKEDRGEIRLGMSDGRMRILMPDLIGDFRLSCPKTELRITSATAAELRQMLADNKLDIILVGADQNPSPRVTARTLLRESIYLVATENMLRRYYTGNHPDFLASISEKGIDLAEFKGMPFAMNLPTANSSMMLQEYFAQKGLQPNCVHRSSYPDLHHMMAAKDYAATFCLTMYIPKIRELNTTLNDNMLRILPLKEFTQKNNVTIEYEKGRSFPYYGNRLIEIISRRCELYYSNDIF